MLETTKGKGKRGWCLLLTIRNEKLMPSAWGWLSIEPPKLRKPQHGGELPNNTRYLKVINLETEQQAAKWRVADHVSVYRTDRLLHSQLLENYSFTVVKCGV